MKHIDIYIYIFALFFLTNIEAKSSKNAQTDSIQLLIKEFRYNQALDLIDENLLKEPSSLNLHLLKGSVLREMYSYKSSLKSFKEALEIDSTNNQILIEVANACKLLQDYDHSLLYYSKALKKDTANRFLQIECANCKFLNDQFKDAIVDFRKIYQKDTLNCYAIQRLAYSYCMTAEIDSSIFYYKKAIAIDSSDVTSILSLSNLYKSTKEYQKGINITEDFIRDNPNNANANVNSTNAYFYLLNKQYDPAIKKFKKCIELHDTSEFTLKNLGIAYYALDSFELAKEDLEKAYQLDSTDINTLHCLGISCYRSIYKELGILYMEKAVRHYDPILKELAMVYRDYSEACNKWSKSTTEKKLAASLKAYEFNSGDPILALQIGIEYDINKHDYKKAIEFYEVYVKSKPEKFKNIPTKFSPYSHYENRILELKKLLKNPNQ